MLDEGLPVLERCDGMAPLRNALRKIADVQCEWAGIPMPLEGERLVIESTYPKAKEFMAMGGPDRSEPEEPHKIRNSFWSSHKRSEIVIFEKEDGRIEWGLVPGANHMDQTLRTLMCSDAWGIEQERNAIDLLGTLIGHRAFKQYLLTGMFIETSKRSGIIYLFRRLKPTVAIRTVGDKLRILCTLCLHAIGYYQGSWAGVMTPTDDLVSHLMMARCDEAMFWRRANQTPAWRPEAGV